MVVHILVAAQGPSFMFDEEKLGSWCADLEMQRQKMSELEQSLFEAEHARDQLNHKESSV